jgi:guanine deaminase
VLFIQQEKFRHCCRGRRRAVPGSAQGYLDLRGQLLLPGFVDAHVHYPQTEMIGAFGEQLLEWLTTYTFPVESQFADAAYAAEIAQFFINQLLSHGTTTALVFCTCIPNPSMRCLAKPCG